jgi:outer membrane lipoprotein SlyB
MKLILPVLIAMCLPAAAAADVLGAPKTSTSTTSSGAQAADSVFRGTVEQATDITIAESTGAKPTGAAVGMLLGLAAGRHSLVGAIVGGVVGVVGGAAIAAGLSRSQGQDLFIKLDAGRLVHVAQRASEFAAGDRVLVVVTRANRARVLLDAGSATDGPQGP